MAPFKPVTRDIIFLLLGLVLLFTPRGWLRLGRAEGGSKRKKKVFTGGANRDRLPGDNSVWAGEEFARRRNWLDLLRGLAGGYAIMTTVPTVLHGFIGVPDASLGNVVFATQGGILLGAVAVQMVRLEERLTFFPPIFFVLGLAFPVVGVLAALIAFFTVWAINIVLPNPASFMATFGGGIAILSVFIGYGPKRGALMAALSLFPPVVSVLVNRRLAAFRKRTKIIVR